MSNWSYSSSGAPAGNLILKNEIALPAYAGMSDEQIAVAITFQTEPDPTPFDMSEVRRSAVEARIWGKLKSYSTRAFVTTAAQQDLTNACANFMSLFQELSGVAVLIRGNPLWNAMDADLTLMTASAGGGPVLTVAQANFMRAFGDRTRPKWYGGVAATDVLTARQAT